MKTIGRIFIILALSLVVVGGAVAFSHTSLATQLFSGSGPEGGRGQFEGRQPPTDLAAQNQTDPGQFEQGTREGRFAEGQFPGGDGFRGGEGGRASMNNLLDLMKNLVIIIVIVLFVALIDIGLKRRRKKAPISASI